MFILGFIATVLSVIGYLIVSNVRVSKQLKLKGFYIRLFAALLFIIYTLINKDYNVFILTLFYSVVDVYNLYMLIKTRDKKYFI